LKRISIVGLGLIGGSIAKALKNANAELNISAFDPIITDENINLYKPFLDTVLSSEKESLENSDIIFICTPLETALKQFSELAPLLNENQIITDVSGVKFPFEEIWKSCTSKGKYIGGHPMTGKEKGGFENSDPLLFENAIYILTKETNDNYLIKEFEDLIHLLGANILHIPAKQHDVIAASVSHLPQLISVALVNTASLKTDKYNFLDLAAGGFRDMTRIASSDFSIWESVIAQNKDEILAAIEKFQIELDSMKSSIEKLNLNKLKDRFESSRKTRDEIPKNTKGFLSPLFDVFVFVKDEPGVISKISTALFNRNINIKDIELLKIREGSGGTFRLSFESKLDSEEAKSIIQEIGFEIR